MWSQSFWQRQHFCSLAAVERARPQFEQWYWHEYAPPSLAGATPAQAHRQAERPPLRARQVRAVPAALPITAGRLHFIRQVDAEGFLSLLNEDWKVGKRLAGQYVWATIVTHQRRLVMYHRRSADEQVRLVKTWHYEIPKPVAPLLGEFKRSHRRRNMFTML